MKYRTALLGALLSVAVGATPTPFAASDLHFALSKSMPEADSSIESPSEVRLWFTEAPEDNTTSIRVVDAAGELIAAGDVVQDKDDGKIFSVALESRLTPGAYTVGLSVTDGRGGRGVYRTTTKIVDRQEGVRLSDIVIACGTPTPGLPVVRPEPNPGSRGCSNPPDDRRTASLLLAAFQSPPRVPSLGLPRPHVRRLHRRAPGG